MQPARNLFPVGLTLALLLLVVLCGCRRGFDARVVSLITKDCHNTFPCVVQVKDATDFAWDKMYVISYTAHQPDVEKALGITLKPFTEFTRKVVFTNNGHLVHYEEQPTNVEHPVENEVAFEIPTGKDYAVYNADTKFTASKLSSPDGTYYYLQPVGAQ